MASDNPSFHPLNALNEGGPGAFLPEPGISLRDWFAGQALIGAGTWMPMGFFNLDAPESHTRRAQWAYAAADAMLAARVQA